MSDARTVILGRLRAAQATARVPGPPAARHSPNVSPTVSRAECLARFQEELSALGVESHLETTQDCVQRRVTTLLAGRRVLSWDREALPYALGSIVGDAVFAGDPRDAQAAAEVGLTGCDAAIAETGSLVLLSGPGRSRAVSLLPPVHLAVVRSEDLCFSLGDVFRTHAGRLSQAASCTLITGPSRTADIELTLTLGVHGPGTVLVVIGP